MSGPFLTVYLADAMSEIGKTANFSKFFCIKELWDFFPLASLPQRLPLRSEEQIARHP